MNSQLTLQLVFMNPICSASTFPGTPQSQAENKSKVTNLPHTSLCINIMLKQKIAQLPHINSLPAHVLDQD